jgi:prepilin-type N-terminal cleavage/methylation domain-containing protein
MEKAMKSQQSGFTLVEIAIVLVIIGLLLGGILKGQELINSAKVKNLANDFRTIPTYIYGYQDKFRALPGDDRNVVANLGVNAVPATTGGAVGNGVIEGAWDSAVVTDESYLFWQHVRLANLAPGSTDATAAGTPTYRPQNALGGIIGISSITTNAGGSTAQITGMSGSYQICSKGILGKFVKQLDVTLDVGDPQKGSLRAAADNVTGAVPGAAAAVITVADEGTPYTVCMSF